ncbi:kinase-like domain-containing protein [Pilobolus umbonatus]|nr:kinase-like domain-containing protein [Pilobolus umbonatus]
MAPPITVPCRYQTGKVLGNGTYAVVKECMEIETKKYYACKIINKGLMEGREHMVRNEINILKRISQGHQNILSLIDYFETMNNLYLVTDLATGGELFDRICAKGNYFEKDAAHIINTVCEAVAYLHDNGVVHRDLKPENLLFRTPDEDADLLIADFGLSRIIDSDKFHTLKTTCGTPGYMAPEILKHSGHGKPVDVWAIGVITFFVLSGYTPFESSDAMNETSAILTAGYTFDDPSWAEVSEQAKHFIRRCLTVDPDERITIHEALNHEWLVNTKSSKDGDLLPNLKTNFNARHTFKKAVQFITLTQHIAGTKSTDKSIKPVNEKVAEVLKTS